MYFIFKKMETTAELQYSTKCPSSSSTSMNIIIIMFRFLKGKVSFQYDITTENMFKLTISPPQKNYAEAKIQCHGTL